MGWEGVPHASGAQREFLCVDMTCWEKKNDYSRAERDRVKGGGKAGNTNQSYNYAKKNHLLRPVADEMWVMAFLHAKDDLSNI